MELRHVRYFVGVAEYLHFRKAAQRLQITQPALSRHALAIVALPQTRRAVSITSSGWTTVCPR